MTFETYSEIQEALWRRRTHAGMLSNNIELECIRSIMDALFEYWLEVPTTR